MRKIRLLVVDDSPDWVKTAREILEDQGYEVVTATSGEQARRHLHEQFFDLLLLDERMPGISGTALLAESRQRYPGIGAILITAYGDLAVAVRAMRAGALNLLQKPVSRDALLAAVAHALDESQLAREERYLWYETQAKASFAQILGNSPAFQRAMDLVRQVTPTDIAVLLLGETGTGKELVARAIHFQGPRKERPFVVLNSAGIAPLLAESTLFGHRKGAFTDAKENHVGFFEAAKGGTIFLDEIGEMSPEGQVRLLRVLEQKTITRLGETVEIPVDVRVIAATNRDLQAEMRVGRFREDLFYRLAVMPISLPPLRERKEDIIPLAMHFLEINRRKVPKTIRRITPEALAKLAAYSWPGNVRQLDNIILQAVLVTSGDTITPEAILVKEEQPSAAAGRDTPALTFKEAKERFERHYFTELLATTGDNRTEAARQAGMDRTVLYDHLRELGLLDRK